MVESRFLEFRLDYSENKDLGVGQFVSSEVVSAGGHLWRVVCYPSGDSNAFDGEYASIFLRLVSDSANVPVRAIFEAFLLNRDGTPSATHAKRCVHVFQPELPWGWARFVKRSDVEALFVANGLVTFMCAVLAARSPVFEAQLLGAMADARVPSITVQDMEPAAFRALLQYMYTDSLPADAELGDSDSLVAMMQHLVAAADRYALDRLKTMCSLKLTENVSADTVGSILVCAETYGCPELKKRCLDFFAVENNFKKAAFTDGFVNLVQKYPLLSAELRRRVGV